MCAGARLAHGRALKVMSLRNVSGVLFATSLTLVNHRAWHFRGLVTERPGDWLDSQTCGSGLFVTDRAIRRAPLCESPVCRRREVAASRQLRRGRDAVFNNQEEARMLVLSRRIQERIFIGDDIVLTVTRISCDRAWIGILAPRDVVIRREEVPAEKTGGDRD